MTEGGLTPDAESYGGQGAFAASNGAASSSRSAAWCCGFCSEQGYACGVHTRPPAVAGSFYPGDAARLRAEVARLLAAAAGGPAPKALIAPHAGYIYSGPIAASAFKRVREFTRVVLLGPSHYAWLDGVALPDAQSFATPLGEVPIEAPPGLTRSRAAHEREHSLEVEVPFLQVALGEFRLVPLAVDRTRIECGWAFAPEAVARPGFDPGYAVEFWDLINRQDWAACESVQRGLASPHALPGPLSPTEDAVYSFVTTIARGYLGQPVWNPPRQVSQSGG